MYAYVICPTYMLKYLMICKMLFIFCFKVHEIRDFFEKQQVVIMFEKTQMEWFSVLFSGSPYKVKGQRQVPRCQINITFLYIFVYKLIKGQSRSVGRLDLTYMYGSPLETTDVWSHIDTPQIPDLYTAMYNGIVIHITPIGIIDHYSCCCWHWQHIQT